MRRLLTAMLLAVLALAGGPVAGGRAAPNVELHLRRYRSVIFWCVPFTQTLARANLRAS